MTNRIGRGIAVLLRALVGEVWRETASNLPSRHACGQACLESLESRQLCSAAPFSESSSANLESSHAMIASVRKVAVKSPPAPILSVSPLSSTQVRLSWVTRSAKKVAISMRAGDNKSWELVKTVAATKQLYTINGLEPNKSYMFRVRSLQADGSWLWSTGVNTTTPPLPSPPSSDDVTYSGPITITGGGTYTGNWQSLNRNVPAVRIRTNEPVIIENSNIRSRGALIDVYGFAANITIRNNVGYGMNPNVRGEHAGRFLDVDGFANVDVENNYMEGTAGIYLYDYRGDFSKSQTVKVLANQAKNIDGRASDGKGGYYFEPDEDYVQFFQIDGVQSIRNAEVAWNQVINEPGKSLVEDNINMYRSSGTANDPFRIHDNYIDGAYPVDPARSTDYSGGGIMLSDKDSSFIVAYGNQVLDTTNYGISISSGHDNVFYDNRIFSAGVLPNGKPIPTQNVGAYIWNVNDESTFDRNSGHDNLIGWINNDGRNDWWVPDASGWNNNTSLKGNVTPATIQAEWTFWQTKLAKAGILSGLQ